MPKPDDHSEEALSRLDDQLNAFETQRARSASPEVNRSIGEGYRLIAELIGGVLGGLGIGWFIDRLFHTAPFGIAGGLVIGAGVSVYLAVSTAARMGAKAAAESGAVSVPPDDDED